MESVNNEIIRYLDSNVVVVHDDKVDDDDSNCDEIAARPISLLRELINRTIKAAVIEENEVVIVVRW